jgi:hypothetical protein
VLELPEKRCWFETEGKRAWGVNDFGLAPCGHQPDKVQTSLSKIKETARQRRGENNTTIHSHLHILH